MGARGLHRAVRHGPTPFPTVPIANVTGATFPPRGDGTPRGQDADSRNTPKSSRQMARRRRRCYRQQFPLRPTSNPRYFNHRLALRIRPAPWPHAIQEARSSRRRIPAVPKLPATRLRGPLVISDERQDIPAPACATRRLGLQATAECGADSTSPFLLRAGIASPLIW